MQRIRKGEAFSSLSFLVEHRVAGFRQRLARCFVAYMIDANKVKALAEEWLADKEYFLVEATVEADNRVVVEIDHKDGVWIEDCCELSRYIDKGLDREVEDFELEVGSSGLGRPFKVLQQYVNAVGEEVELLTTDGVKLKGVMQAADEAGFSVSVIEKRVPEGKKRPVKVEVERHFAYTDVKWVKTIIKFQ